MYSFSYIKVDIVQYFWLIAGVDNAGPNLFYFIIKPWYMSNFLWHNLDYVRSRDAYIYAPQVKFELKQLLSENRL